MRTLLHALLFSGFTALSFAAALLITNLPFIH